MAAEKRALGIRKRDKGYLHCAALQIGGVDLPKDRMEPERLEPTLAERLDASAELLSETQAAKAGADDSSVTAETGKQPLRERLSEFRRRLVIKDLQRRWWQPKNR